MKRWTKILLNVLIVVAVICATFTVTVFWMQGRYASSLPNDEVRGKMQNIESILEHYFIDDYDPDILERAAADGAAAAMIEATGDQWSYYISADDMQSYEEKMNNAYVGIGVTIQPVESGMEIMSVVPDGPAAEAGIQIGDICIEAEGEATAPLGIDGTQAIVRGEEGTYVALRFLRGDETYDVQVERRAIVTDVATLEMLEDGVALITIANFDYHCAEQTLACIESAMEQEAKALLFDVRFNGGGLKDEMVEILDVLLPQGDVFFSVDYRGVEEVETSDANCVQIPMAVLVNEESYSAAEFFAAALQEFGVAKVIGAQTTGKGNFQYTIDVGDGSAVSLSVGKYYTPKGLSLTDVGVTPDVVQDLTYDDLVSLYYHVLPHEEDEQLQAALSALK